MQVGHAAGEVTFQVVDRVEVLVVCSRRGGELDRVRVFAGRAGQPGPDLVRPVVVVPFVGDDGVGGVARDRGVEGAGAVRGKLSVTAAGSSSGVIVVAWFQSAVCMGPPSGLPQGESQAR